MQKNLVNNQNLKSFIIILSLEISLMSEFCYIFIKPLILNASDE